MTGSFQKESAAALETMKIFGKGKRKAAGMIIILSKESEAVAAATDNFHNSSGAVFRERTKILMMTT